MYESKRKYSYGTGRRKSSVARVRVYENGTGSIIINGRDMDDYFGLVEGREFTNSALSFGSLINTSSPVHIISGGHAHHIIDKFYHMPV